ncbi:hypothetical protein SNOG_10766 [Parastagonospora nodorum SN15]|uniref:Uncharacterized protein n=1 Tax=Phaeosphaeria nodorum (strain SN15 / ATCC MYA-4574 / FGSC 10173) TaxID=321614 RepID=Q0UBU8_PHANO|nr:hypothetical protein SNOG_10766 [Parastagonospora nodorum SN15]EAT82160.1 hypothetical protein SNOG_10766 [Parastagonospora nodorum SN15]
MGLRACQVEETGKRYYWFWTVKSPPLDINGSTRPTVVYNVVSI